MIFKTAILLAILGLIIFNAQVFGGRPKETEASIINIWLSPNYDPESPFPLDAKAGIVLNRHTGEVFFKKNEDMVLPIASLTKIMTAMIALDRGAVNQDLLDKALIISDNDAAEKLAGKEGVWIMNEKARELGMLDTFFEDASGLSPNNVSTIKDLLKMVEYSLGYPEIWQTLAKPKYKKWPNRNELLGKHGVIAGKTGFTDEAGQCLILLTDDLITIVLNASDRFEESEKLIELFNETRQ